MRYYLIAGGVLLIVIVIVALVASAGSGDTAGLFASPKVGPETAKALALEQAIRDHHVADSVRTRAAAQQVACGVAAQNAFDPVTGANKFWFFRWEDGTLECYDSGGFHRIRGVRLEPLGPDQIKIIVNNPTKYTTDGDFWSTPRRAPQGAATPVPMPVPQLGEEPCCNR